MHSMIHVGSPRYIEDVLPNTTTYADPVVRRLFFADDIEAFRDDQEASALSVSNFSEFDARAGVGRWPHSIPLKWVL